MSTVKVRTDYAGNPAITSGREYPAEVVMPARENEGIGPLLRIRDDEGAQLLIYPDHSAHIDGNKWDVLEDQSE